MNTRAKLHRTASHHSSHRNRSFRRKPLSIPLLHAGRPLPLVITGACGTGKTTIATHIVDYLTHHGWHAASFGKTAPRHKIEEFAEQTGPKVVLLDEAETVFQYDPQHWAQTARTAHHHDMTILAVTHSLAISAFGGNCPLRNTLTRGSTIRMWTNDREPGTHLDFSRLDRQGHGYLFGQTGAPCEVRTGQHVLA